MAKLAQLKYIMRVFYHEVGMDSEIPLRNFKDEDPLQ